ncbi:Glycerone kinase, partial [mine drainage metagenome]
MTMQKLLNDPGRFVDEMLEGLLLAHPLEIRAGTRDRTIVSPAQPRQLESPRVAIVTGGGSGHLPLFVGYVGEGMVDGAAVGDVFASPSADQVLAVTRDVSQGQGVVYVYGNYSGDLLNFGLGAELALAEGIETRTVLGCDDIASAAPGS